MTATVSNRKETAFGTKRIVEFDVALGAYTGGGTGVSLDPTAFGMRNVDIVIIEPGTDGYIYEYDYVNKSMKAYMAGGVAFSATVSAPAIAVTGAVHTVVGGIGAGTGPLLSLTNGTVSGKLSKSEATNRLIPLAAFGLGASSGALATSPTFGAATAQASLAEVASATLSTAVHCLAIGD
jgi:hypothetical protein